MMNNTNKSETKRYNSVNITYCKICFNFYINIQRLRLVCCLLKCSINTLRNFKK